MQVEETTREREERLKGWSNFLEGANPGQQDAAPPAEGATTAEPREPPTSTGPETDTQEREVDSTDSSLAGSDDEEA